MQEEEKRGGKKGRLLGIITLSDVLKYVIGEVGIGEGIEPDEEISPTTPIRPPPTPSPAPSLARQEEPHDVLTPKPAERSLTTPPAAAETS